MKKLSVLFALLLVTALSGCSVIAGIFKAGAVTGIIVVVVIIAILIWLVSLFKK